MVMPLLLCPRRQSPARVVVLHISHHKSEDAFASRLRPEHEGLSMFLCFPRAPTTLAAALGRRRPAA